MMFLNVAALGLSVYLILHTILPSLEANPAHAHSREVVVEESYSKIVIALVLLSLPLLIPFAKKVTTHSIWAHPHFSGATLAQFFYVAAQAGIFSFFINSMTVDKSNGSAMVPELPQSWNTSAVKDWGWIQTRTAISPAEVKDFPALVAWLKNEPDPVAAFINSQLSRPPAPETATPAQSGDPAAPVTAVPEAAEKSAAPSTAAKAPAETHPDDAISMLAEYKEGPVAEPLQKTLVSELNRVIRQEIGNKPGKKDNKPEFYDAQRFAGVKFSQKTLDQAAELSGKEQKSDHSVLRLNRLVLEDSLPGVLPYHDSILAISDKGASFLSSIAFGCFLLGRISGAWLLKRFSAHKTLGLYA
jgi:hypothetical protein